MTDKRKAYEEKYDARLREWSAKIELFKAKADLAKADLKIDYYKTIDTLQNKSDGAKTKLQELKASSDEAWEDIKVGADNVWNDVKTSFNTASSRFQ